jgi:histidinol-phosphatase (PHP family)
MRPQTDHLGNDTDREESRVMLTNYHTHCRYCDGAGDPAEYADAAVRKRFDVLGFSSHAPLPFENDWTMPPADLEAYLAEIRRLKSKYREKPQVLLGLEIDFIPGLISPCDPRYDALGLDYRIGSVHSIPDPNTGTHPTVDDTEQQYAWILNTLFDGDTEAFVKRYYRLVREMLSHCTPDILGHFDLIKKNNRDGAYFSEEAGWYREAVVETIEAVAASGVIMEVNTGGLARGSMSDIYPSEWILRLAQERRIPITINADAHTPQQIDAYYDLARSKVESAGYTMRHVLKDGSWGEVPL